MSIAPSTFVPTLIARRFTVDEFDRMIAAGILSEDERVELLNGVIVAMAPIGDRHNACVNRLTYLLTTRLGGRAIVQIQGPIRVRPDDDSRPEPDVAVLRPREDFYEAGRPTSADILLLIEVAETSSVTDRSIKLPLYARAGIEESWLVDLAAGVIVVARGPRPDGRWEQVSERRRGDRLTIPGFPDCELSVDEILGGP